MDHSPIKISADILVKEFNCSICFNMIEDCYTTKCGHLFCKNCILESINRHHKCPFCQAALQESDVFRDFALNNLRKLVFEERDRAQKEYIESLYNNINQNKMQEENSLETIFLFGLKDIIIAYHKYLSEVEDKFNMAKLKLRNENISKSNQILQNSEDGATQKLLAQKALFDKEMQTIDEQFKTMKEYIYNSLRGTVKNLIPDPNMLEIRCTLTIPQKDARIDKFMLNPSQKTNIIKQELTTHFLKLNNPIQTFDDTSVHVVVIPPERYVECNSLISEKPNITSLESVLMYLKSVDQKYNLPAFKVNSEELLAKQKIPQNSVLLLYGVFTLKSEAPTECMTYDYKNGVTMNYFSCDNCKINWICSNCADHCHKGHSLLPYLTGHKTTWACCYCVSKGFCKALNKNSKK